MGKVIYTYGDLWHIIGFMAMRSGPTTNNSGLHVRTEEIETTNEKDCLLRLTRNPQEMMDFSGLDCSRYEKGSSTLDELFEWAISLSLSRKRLFEKDIISEEQERVREKRPMYAKFVTEWLSQRITLHPSAVLPEEVGQISSQAKTPKLAGYATSATARYLGNEPAEEGKAGVSLLDERKEVLNKAPPRFNKREEYQKVLEGHEKRALEDTMWKVIARLLPIQGKELSQAMTALKALL